MKKPYIINESNYRIETGYIGEATIEDVIGTIEAVTSDPRFHPDMDSICDYSEATVDWSLTDLDRLRKHISILKKKIGQAHWAVIFPKGKDNSTARIFITLYSAFDKQIEIKLFKDRNEAVSWLESIQVSL